jgi:hypothetical protein
MMRVAPRIWMAMVAGLALSVAACATTTYTSTWKAPGARPFDAHGKKVVGLVMTRNAAARRSAEDALARELTALGAQGVAAYTLLPDTQTNDEAAAKAVLSSAGAVGVVAMRPVATNQEVSSTPSTMYMGPTYRGFWSGGYYGYGWGGAWSAPTIRTDTIVTVETLVYSLVDNQLLWGGQSRTTNPANADQFVRELVKEAVKAIKKQGLL